MLKVRAVSVKILLMFFSLILIWGCSQSNKITDSWVNPDATKESIKFKKVAVFALVMKTTNRQYIEDQICKRMVNTIAVPSYKIINENDMTNTELVKTQLAQKGFDGALVLTLVDVDKREAYSPGVYPSYYYNFGDYYGYTWGFIYSYGGTFIDDIAYTAEINIYSIKDNKLIWSGETISVNPDNLEEVIVELSESIKDKLVSAGLLEKSNDSVVN